MGKSLLESGISWAKSGFKTASDEVIESRLAICKACEFWNAEGFNGTGRCMKCGCSTWAKLRLATESCPIGKWSAS